MIDTRRGIVTETIATALFPRAPEGSTPDALAVAPTARRSTSPTPTTTASPSSTSSIPAGARSRASSPPAGIRRPSPSRPTASRCWSASARGTRPGRTRSTRAKGEVRSRPSASRGPAGRSPTSAPRSRARCRSSPVPDDKALAAYTETVYRNCPYSDKLLTDAPYPREDGDPDQGRRPVADQACASTSSRRTGPTTRSSATSPGATATRRW